MTKTELVTKLNEVGAVVPGKIVKLDFGPDGSVLLDGNSKQVSEDAPAGDADATIHVSWADFGQLAKGELNPMTAFMSGKLRLDGDMGVAMQLQSVFSKLNG